MAFPFDDCAFDAVFALETLHHTPDRAQVLSEVKRVLKPGAALAMGDFVLRAPGKETESAAVMRSFRTKVDQMG